MDELEIEFSPERFRINEEVVDSYQLCSSYEDKYVRLEKKVERKINSTTNTRSCVKEYKLTLKPGVSADNVSSAINRTKKGGEDFPFSARRNPKLMERIKQVADSGRELTVVKVETTETIVEN